MLAFRPWRTSPRLVFEVRAFTDGNVPLVEDEETDDMEVRAYRERFHHYLVTTELGIGDGDLREVFVIDRDRSDASEPLYLGVIRYHGSAPGPDALVLSYAWFK